jgi:hypothetical protein
MGSKKNAEFNADSKTAEKNPYKLSQEVISQKRGEE